MRGMLRYFNSGDEEPYATPDMQTYGRWRFTLFRMHGTALKLERGRVERERVQEQLFRFDPFSKEKH